MIFKNYKTTKWYIYTITSLPKDQFTFQNVRGEILRTFSGIKAYSKEDARKKVIERFCTPVEMIFW